MSRVILTGTESKETVKHIVSQASDVIFTKEALSRYIQCVLSGNLSFDDIHEMADCFEWSDAVEYAEGEEMVIRRVLFDLSTPELNGEITREKCESLYRDLVQS